VRIHRTVPPTAAPLSFGVLWHGLVGIFLGNQYLKRLEREVKEYFGVRYVFFVASGTAGLYLILQALKTISHKQEVVIPAYNCFSVPSAIVKAGLKVSLCDVNPETLDFDYRSLKETINEETLCVIPNHLFGIPSDMGHLTRLCKDKGVFLIEDSAQAMGGKYNGRMLGTMGSAGVFSLSRGKNLTCGSGGIVVTNLAPIANAIERQYAKLASPNLAHTINEFLQVAAMSLFVHPNLYWLPAGLPFLRLGKTTFLKEFPVARFSGMKAGLLFRWQERLERSNRNRAGTADYYCRLLSFRYNDAPIPYLRLPFITRTAKMRHWIESKSRKLGLGVGPMYPTAINEIAELRSEFNGKSFPGAMELGKRLITIPTHHLLSEKDKKAIAELFRELSIADGFSVGHNPDTPTPEARQYL